MPSLIMGSGIFGGGSGSSTPAESSSLLFHHTTNDIQGSTVVDQTGVSSLTPRNLWSYSANEVGVDATIPHGIGSAGASLDFGWTDNWGITGWLKTTDTSVTNRVLSNRVWSGDFQGCSVLLDTGGYIDVQLWGDNSPSYRVRKQMGALGDDINGTAKNIDDARDGTWRFFAVFVTGNATPGNIDIDIYMEADDGTIVKDSSTVVETGTYSTQVLESGSDWGLANFSTGSRDADMQFQHIKFFNQVKTFTEVIDIYNHKDDTTGLIRYYPCEEEDGSTLYNAAIVDTGNRLHGTIAGGGSTGS